MKKPTTCSSSLHPVVEGGKAGLIFDIADGIQDPPYILCEQPGWLVLEKLSLHEKKEPHTSISGTKPPIISRNDIDAGPLHEQAPTLRGGSITGNSNGTPHQDENVVGCGARGARIPVCTYPPRISFWGHGGVSTLPWPPRHFLKWPLDSVKFAILCMGQAWRCVSFVHPSVPRQTGKPAAPATGRGVSTTCKGGESTVCPTPSNPIYRMGGTETLYCSFPSFPVRDSLP